MILTGSAIKSAVKQGQIVLAPFHTVNLNPNSYNYHLSENLLVPDDASDKWQRVTLTEDGYVLQPRKLYLGATLEKIGSDRFVTLLLGRSSIGRLGLFLNVTADLGHLGSCSHWTLELHVVQPVRVYPKMRIGQVSFWTTESHEYCSYRGRYYGDVEPVANRDQELTHER